MDNKEKYKKIIDKIHVSDGLKKKTLNKINNRVYRNHYIKYLATGATLLLVIMFGIYYVLEMQKNNSKKNSDIFSSTNISIHNPTVSVENDLSTFKDIDELRKILKENIDTLKRTSNEDFITTGVEEASTEFSTNLENSKSSQSSNNDFSTTNIQVEGVDEADIIKTDGKYIYYVNSNLLYIIDADTLEEVNKIDFANTSSLNQNFFINEIYLVNNRLVVLGNYYYYETSVTSEKRLSYDIEIINSNYYAKAIIYNVSNPKNIIQEREIKIDGTYTNSRMIGNCLYFISTKAPVYYDKIEDFEILPSYQINNEEKVYIPANKIVYFPNTNSYQYVIIAGIDISKDEDVNIASFFGSWPDKIYASENNIYIPLNQYWYENNSNYIYKFSLKNAKIEYVAKGSFEGYLDSQFSIDEYNGFLRIATTSGYDDKSTNTLYTFNSNLEEVSKLTDIAKGEKIYSVRFIGKIGYIVTFEQIDPLFVIDLSDPYHPEIKGELEMPGYSSYLHPYDETHIIGIGYNVKSNGYGGVKNSNMKIAMFDVSDLNNPKEMFNTSIGEENVYSELNYNHKALFYSKSKNLIGFPIQSSGYDYSKYTDNFTIFEIDLEKGFIVHGKIEQIHDFRTSIKRAIYIGDNLYTFSESFITKYNLDTFEKLQELRIY